MVSRYIKQLVISEDQRGERIDKALALQVDDVSRTQLTKWLRDGEITVNRRVVKPNFKVNGGESIEICGTPDSGQNWSASDEVDFEIVFEDEHILVINKPAGLVVHPGAATIAPTLANGLIHYRPSQEQLPRAGIVHRLDKDTTGLMVVAASEIARQYMIEALATRLIERTYLAIVEGRLPSQRVVDLPLGRSTRNRTIQAVRLDGKTAISYFNPIKHFRVHTLLRARLETGRTHQIRVHASRIGFPLVGDRSYGAKRTIPPHATEELTHRLKHFPRQALHATKLEFKHPVTQRAMKFQVPLPNDMSQLQVLLEEDQSLNQAR